MASTVAPISVAGVDQPPVFRGEFLVAIAQRLQTRIDLVDRRQGRVVQGRLQPVAKELLPPPAPLAMAEDLELGDPQRPGPKASSAPGRYSPNFSHSVRLVS